MDSGQDVLLPVLVLLCSGCVFRQVTSLVCASLFSSVKWELLQQSLSLGAAERMQRDRIRKMSELLCGREEVPENKTNKYSVTYNSRDY